MAGEILLRVVVPQSPSGSCQAARICCNGTLRCCSSGNSNRSLRVASAKQAEPSGKAVPAGQVEPSGRLGSGPAALAVDSVGVASASDSLCSRRDISSSRLSLSLTNAKSSSRRNVDQPRSRLERQRVCNSPLVMASRLRSGSTGSPRHRPGGLGNAPPPGGPGVANKHQDRGCGCPAACQGFGDRLHATTRAERVVMALEGCLGLPAS